MKIWKAALVTLTLALGITLSPQSATMATAAEPPSLSMYGLSPGISKAKVNLSLRTTVNLHMRSGAGTGYRSITVIPQGVTVKATEMLGGWYKVSYGGKTGWSLATYLTSAHSAVKVNESLETTVNLHLRAGVGTSYRSVTVIPKGKVVKATELSNGWYKVTYGGKTGWSSGVYLKKGPPSPTPSPTPKPAKNQFAHASVNMRSGPGASNTKILTIPKGSAVSVSEAKPGWVKVTYNKRTGWSSTNYIKPAKVPPANAYERQVRQILDKHGCSDAGLIVNDPRIRLSGAADWYNNTVLLKSGIGARLGYITSHECVHLLQYDVYGGNLTLLQADMNRIYGGTGYTGLERNADCITHRWGYKNQHYTSSCSGARGRAADAILAGKRP